MLLNTWQTTLKSSVEFTGKGLHKGQAVRMIVEPAPVNTGIVFSRADLSVSQMIPARADLVSTSQLCTTLGAGDHAVSTIEHLMAAFAGLGISNARVIVDGPELPIMDGSSSAFVHGLMSVGLRQSPERAKAYRLRKPLVILDGDKMLRLDPAERQSIKCSIDFKSKAIGAQSIEYRESLDGFLQLANARTFCHLSDVEMMRSQGLALGGGLDNAIVVTDDEVLNQEGLRSQDEFVRHKLLDLIGDFALLGAPLLARISAHKSGHAMHARCLQVLLSQKEQYLEEFYPDLEEESKRRVWNAEGRSAPSLSPALSYA
ncbi:MAG: UDP-3-O-[3-hydroxymyristoyl] N-acetylglucosamine deacetylase [Proteobacteria bacterium]|nr:MAG: UDP-3-O-[3-hydroxymyristoyl] N-acetylglucosamine deacetylase [Pseudomonadota bacterium]